MAGFSFSLNAEGTVQVYEILCCLAKFGERVSLEARAETLTLTALNLSRTAYASFALDANTFLLEYKFHPVSSVRGNDRFTCQLYNKALQSVFKGRSGDRGREPIERCNVCVEDREDQAECRLVTRMFFNHGMTKTYRLTYESTEVMHALFDKVAATQGWRISARVLREYIEFFGPKTEQLDILAQQDKIVFTSYTEKIQDGKEVLRQPLETAIAIHTDDFEDYHMQQGMHIVISVKDFKAIVTHAESLRGSVSAQFSFPNRPLQFHYQDRGLHCEFTLMTSGDLRAASATPSQQFTSNRSHRHASVHSIMATSFPTRTGGQPKHTTEMLPPPRPPIVMPSASNPETQSPNLAAITVANSTTDGFDHGSESLFIPENDEDQTWDPPNFDQEERGEDMLGWDANNAHGAIPHPTFRDSGGSAPRTTDGPSLSQASEGLPPTQRLSQLHGLFD
ncbi:Rad9-domain-containing protein [Polychaeton citri CBS 116435]|uniref:DNA repair protein rad9 n=1 Tax=Polychaeton citri CBS 116435 TaxID=1314669 RepID=A0A9P4QD53_9PEZI|nr:Rad9-domain-containing protein [Polychaeton citri CBS 116435]